MYIPAAKIFQVLPSEENAIFLDSSLVNELGHYSIIGRKPYLKLEKREDRFYINDTEETSISFENYLRSYLDKQKTDEFFPPATCVRCTWIIFLRIWP